MTIALTRPYVVYKAETPRHVLHSANSACHKEKEYKVFYKNINLNYSIGKVRWRPFAGKYGRIATSPGNFNKELLIVEMPGSRLRSYDSRE